MIAIEPDDFAVGEQITSDYAIVSAVGNYEKHAVYASAAPTDGFQAPTGTSLFAARPDGSVHGWTAVERNGLPWFGLHFEFLVPVDQVNIYALDLGYEGLGIDCVAWSGSLISGCQGPDRFYGMSIGESHMYTLIFDHAIDQLIVGGGHVISAIAFDRLEAHVVPEPSTFVLMAIGLLGIVTGARARRAHK
jgi:hypothetical protein